MFIDRKTALYQGKQKTVPDERGFSLLEVMIAFFLTAVGIMAIMSMQPSAWQASAKADYLGRAALILSAELEKQQALIMNPCNSVTLGSVTNAAVRASGQDKALQGDAVYSVTTNIASIGPNVFTVTVVVGWNNGAGRVAESMVVIRQELWRFPEGCPDA